MVLELRNIEKSFGDKKVLTGVSFKAEGGKAFGLLGRNGAIQALSPQDALSQCSPAQSSSEGWDSSRAMPGRMVTQLGLEVGPCPKAVHTQSSRCSAETAQWGSAN